MGSRYAENTTVDVEASQAEVRRLLKRYGATHLGMLEEPGRGVIECIMRGRQLRFSVQMPPVIAFAKEPAGKQRNQAQIQAAYAKEERRRWRVLVLLLKAKLEITADEPEEFEREFLSYYVLPEGSTVGERLIPGLERMLTTGDIPRLLALPAPKE